MEARLESNVFGGKSMVVRLRLRGLTVRWGWGGGSHGPGVQPQADETDQVKRLLIHLSQPLNRIGEGMGGVGWGGEGRWGRRQSGAELN